MSRLLAAGNGGGKGNGEGARGTGDLEGPACSLEDQCCHAAVLQSSPKASSSFEVMNRECLDAWLEG